MLYSEDKKFIFVAVPKTGTTSIQRRLTSVDSSLLRNRVHDIAGKLVKVPTHASAIEIRKIMGPRAQEFTFVAFLRDPREVVVSKYHFYRSGRAARKQGLAKRRPGDTVRFNLGRTFRVISARLLPLSLWARFYPFSSSSHFITDCKGELIVDQIGTMERLQEDINRIFSAFGYSQAELQLGTANRTQYKRARDPVIDAIAERRLSEDCSLFDRFSTGKY
jgi:hypothetical protein